MLLKRIVALPALFGGGELPARNEVRESARFVEINHAGSQFHLKIMDDRTLNLVPVRPGRLQLRQFSEILTNFH